MRRAPVGLLLMAGLLVMAGLLDVAGCRPFGGSSASPTTPPPLSGSEVEKTINQKLPPQLHGVQNAGDARCPSKIDIGSDKTAECTMVADGQKVKIKVEPDGSGYKVSLDQAVVSTTVLEQNLASTYHQRFTFYCGSANVRVVDAGNTIQCQGTPLGGGAPKLFDVTIQDTSGKYQADIHNP
jgi:hypothetical protein